MNSLAQPLAAYGPWCIRALLLLALLYVAALEAWLVDDAKITFRQVWNFIHGDGMTYNFGERVQAFTHPAWFLLLSALGLVTRELFITTTVLSIALSMGAVGLLLAAESRIRGGGGGRVPLLTPPLLLVFSVAFCDYMTSGLENPLSYFLVGLLLWLIANDGGRRLVFLVLALLVLNRFDFAALFLPLALLLVFARTNHSPQRLRLVRKQGVRHMQGIWRWGGNDFARDIWPGALLLTGWLLFALLYFGSPLPNTYYAKMASGYPLEMALERAADYFSRTATEDPISLAIIAAGVLFSLLSGNRILLALAAGQLLYLGFILVAGGDWMPSGRFFSVPVFLAVGQMMFALSHRQPPAPPPARRRTAPLPLRLPQRLRLAKRGGVIGTCVVGGLLALALCFTMLPRAHDTPLLAATGHFQNKVRTFHATVRKRWGILKMHPSRIAPQPRQMPAYYKRECWAGASHLGQPTIWRIDFCALTDPFLARLPGVRQNTPPGHHRRKLPTNYGEFLLGRVPAIPDESLQPLLQDVALAARAEQLFTRERLSALWRLNSGYYSHLDLSRYADPASQIPAVTADVRFAVPLRHLSGRAKRDGHNWRHWSILPPFFNGLTVELDAPRAATALQLSLSYMEDYEIRVNGELVATIDRVGPEGLLKNHTVPLPRPMRIESVEVRALGRHRHRAFAVGHLHIKEASE